MQKLIKILMSMAIVLNIGLSPTLAKASTTTSSFILPQYSQRVSLDFKDADLKDVLKVFSRQIGANFVMDSNIKDTKVTVYLDKVPVEDAMQRILTANGLSYEYNSESNIFTVSISDKTKKIITRVYPLKYATVPSSKLKSTIAIESTSSSGLTSTSSSSSGSSSSSSTGLINAILSSCTKEGKIAEDPRTNSLIITDEEENFPQIEKVIAKLDVPVTQVLIEVKMLDVSKTASDQIGVNHSGNFFAITGTSIPTFFPFNQKNILNKEGVRDFTSTSLQSESTYQQGQMGFKSMSAVVQFLESKGDTQSLARPRLLTLDNETAQIKISTDEAIGKTIQQTSSSSSPGLSSETAERAKTGVFLTVTPQVNLLANEITLAVSPKVIEASISSITTSDGKPFKDPEERGANIIMKVQAGETIMIGGLLRKKNTKTISRVPLLGSIPFLGRLFRYDTSDNQNRELIIFITPYILNNKGDSLDGKKKSIDFSSRESSMSKREKSIEDDLMNINNRYQTK